MDGYYTSQKFICAFIELQQTTNGIVRQQDRNQVIQSWLFRKTARMALYGQ
jgi:hypothetical protein